MARKVFPSNPSTNDIFTSTKGKKFQWNGKVWKRTQDTSVESMTLDSSADEKLALHGSDNPTIRFREGSNDKGNLHWKASTGEMRLVNEESSEELRLGSGALELTCGIFPDIDDSYDLGSSSKEWRNLHLDGTANIDTLSVSGNATVGGDLEVTGNMDVTGTLTYEDVTNIDSVGVVTARSGLVVSSGGANITGGITGDLTGDVTGNADTATTLATSRTLSISGAGTGSASFNGGANAAIALTLANSGVTAGTYGSSSAIPSITVDAKGLITSASTTAIDSTSISNGGQSVSVSSGGQITSSANHDFSSGIDVTGNITCTGTVTASSDVVLKKNISTIDNALDKVLNLRGVEFDYVENDEHSIGVIAQEVEVVLPDLVHTNEKDDLKSVAYQNLTAVLIEAVKELTSEVNTLKAELNTLKGE